MTSIGAASTRQSPVIVIGAGIIGTCIAYELAKRGARVTLLDRDEPGRGCSFGNSGAISSAAVAPLAMPGIVASAAGMMLDPLSPLHIPLAYLPRALPWLWQFAASAKPDRVERSAQALKALHHDAVENHLRLAAEIGAPDLIIRRGHLFLYPDEATLTEDMDSWRLRERHGIRFERLDRAAILALEPAVGPRYTVGMFIADEATVINPFRYVSQIAKAFTDRGGTLVRDRVLSVRPATNGGWTCRGADRQYAAEHVVIATGAWANDLLGPLGLQIPLESQRGYHVTFKGVHSVVSRTVVFTDRRTFAAPMEEGLRIGGMVEFGGVAREPNYARSALLARFARETFGSLPQAEESHWMGHRPCMPDSVPRIGPVEGIPGMWLAVGHGHLGLTDSINTALQLAPQVMASRGAGTGM